MADHEILPAALGADEEERLRALDPGREAPHRALRRHGLDDRVERRALAVRAAGDAAAPRGEAVERAGRVVDVAVERRADVRRPLARPREDLRPRNPFNFTST